MKLRKLEGAVLHIGNLIAPSSEVWGGACVTDQHLDHGERNADDSPLYLATMRFCLPATFLLTPVILSEAVSSTIAQVLAYK